MNIIENLKVLIAAVEEQPDDVVQLHQWKCGTHFCLAGLVPLQPHFQQLGVTAHPSGAPNYQPDGYCDVFEGLGLLFGQHYGTGTADQAFETIFGARGAGFWDRELDPDDTLTDKELGLARLRRAIAYQEALQK